MHKKLSSSSFEKFVVVAASCVLSFTNFGITRLAGQLYVAAIDRYSVGRKEASLPFTLCYTIRNLSGPIFGYLGNQFGLRFITLAGCLLAAISVGACFLVEDIIPFTVLWGGCYGFAFGLATVLIANILHLYFDKSFSKMHGIFQAFGCMGSLVFPGICDFLLKNYGMSGTLLLLSGFILNCVPAAMLLRTPPIIEKHLEVVENTIKGEKVFQELKVDTCIPAWNIKCNGSTTSEQMLKCSPEVNPTNSDVKYLEIVNHLNSPNGLSTEDDKKIKISYLHPIQYQVNSLTSCKQTEVDELKTSKTTSLHSSIDHQPEKDKVGSNRVNSLGDSPKTTTQNMDVRDKRTMSDSPPKPNVFSRNFKVFLDPTYILILTSLGATTVVIITMYTVIVDACHDKGITQDVAILMTFGVTDMLGRFFLGYVVDGSCLSQVGVFVVCAGCYGILLMSLVWIVSFYMVFLVVAAIGILSGGLFVVPVTIITTWIEKENITMALSSRYVVFALLSFAQSPLIGYFRETLKSYDGLFYLMGCVCVVGALTASLIPAAARHRDKRKVR